MLDDNVLSHQSALCLGVSALKELADEYAGKIKGNNIYRFKAAKTKLALANLFEAEPAPATILLKEAHALAEPLATREGFQLCWDILGKYSFLLFFGAENDEEAPRVKALQEKLSTNALVRQVCCPCPHT